MCQGVPKTTPRVGDLLGLTADLLQRKKTKCTIAAAANSDNACEVPPAREAH